MLGAMARYWMTAAMPSRLVSKYPLYGRAIASDFPSLDGRFIVQKALRYGQTCLVFDKGACRRYWLILSVASC